MENKQSSADAPSGTVRLAWHHFILRTPPAWEVIGYKNDADDGRLVLSTRDGEVLQVYWKKLKEVPSLPRRLTDLVKANVERPPEEEKIRRRLGELHGWQVYRTTSRSVPFFAARHFEKSKVLLTLVFPGHPDTADHAAIEAVLESFAPNDGAERVWAAFGLEVTLPAEYVPDEITALPTAQQIVFENARDYEVKIYRFGMMPDVLGEDDLAVFFARLKGRRRRLRLAGTIRVDNRYDGVHLTYVTRGKAGGVGAIFDRRWLGRIHAWRRDDLKRLFAIENHAPEDRLLPKLAERMVCR